MIKWLIVPKSKNKVYVEQTSVEWHGVVGVRKGLLGFLCAGPYTIHMCAQYKCVHNTHVYTIHTKRTNWGLAREGTWG